NGTDDRLLAATVRPVAPAWRPHTHVLAYADAAGAVRLVDADSSRQLETIHPAEPARGLEWSSDGRALRVRGSHTLELLGPQGRHLRPLGPGAAPVTAAALSPNGRSVAFVQQASTRDGRRSFLW